MSGFLIRVERPEDIAAVRAVTVAAFREAPHSAPPVDASGEPGEAALLDWLRADGGWTQDLSFVAEIGGAIVGHVVATRHHVGDAPALGLGPVSVAPAIQRRGVGSALIRAVVATAEARGETLIAVLGDPAFYGRFGFAAAARLGVESPDAGWGDYFQALPVGGVAARPRGRFRYAAPFGRL